jgi:predicted nuclease of predicted toxin-antitoxin system
VKLLFDENLSHKLVGILVHEFPGCAHVRELGLRAAEDVQIWDHAQTAGLVIVSKDTDFRERSYIEGFPPKIIWLDVGNAGTIPCLRSACRLPRVRDRRWIKIGDPDHLQNMGGAAPLRRRTQKSARHEPPSEAGACPKKPLLFFGFSESVEMN